MGLPCVYGCEISLVLTSRRRRVKAVLKNRGFDIPVFENSSIQAYAKNYISGF